MANPAICSVRSQLPPRAGVDGMRSLDARNLVLTLVAVATAFAGLIHLDERTIAARIREDSGLTRGEIVDRNGQPLAYTVSVGGRAARRYALPGLSTVLGFQTDGHWHGLEKKLDATLTGDRARKDWRTSFLHLEGRSVQGGRVRLTLDRTIQGVANSALGGGNGSVVAIEPSTGEILAMVNKPYCSPDTLTTTAGLQRCAEILSPL